MEKPDRVKQLYKIEKRFVKDITQAVIGIELIIIYLDSIQMRAGFQGLPIL